MPLSAGIISEIILGMAAIRAYAVTWYYPTIQYSFPDEESFKVDIINETGYWLWPGNRIIQVFELDGVNVHQSKYPPI
jgi:hypothetical protein